MADYIPPKKVKLPDTTAVLEGHLWDFLVQPHASDCSKDVRSWVVDGNPVVLILNGREVEVIEPKGANHTFSKWKFQTPDAANRFGELMLPYATVIGLI